MKIAFYKGHKRLFDKFVQWWTKSPYSHTELILAELSNNWALCGSSSFLDRGVRVKQIYLDKNKWDIIDLPDIDENYAIEWYKVHYGKKYDLWGLLGIAMPTREDPTKYWCSEANAASLKIVEAWRYAPAHLYSYALSVAEAKKVVNT